MYTPIKIASGTLTTSNATLATVPNDRTYLVQEIILCNSSSTDTYATVSFDGTKVIPNHDVPLNDSLVLPFNSVLTSGDLIEGNAEFPSVITYYITGLEKA